MNGSYPIIPRPDHFNPRLSACHNRFCQGQIVRNVTYYQQMTAFAQGKNVMFRYKLISTLLLLALLIAAPVWAAGGENGTLDVNGVERSYYLYVPGSYDGTTPVPLMIALHPTSSSGRALALLTGLDAAAEEQGFIVAYPNADGSLWGEDATDPDLPDDLALIPALIDHLAANYTIDTAQVSLVGMGNGGLMAYRLACEMPEKFASMAVVGPLMWDYHRSYCPTASTGAANMLIIHGTDDPFYTHDTHKYDNMWEPEESHTILGVDDTVSFWALRNGCDLKTAAEDVQKRVYANCENGTRLAFYDVQGARTNWPRVGDYKLNQFGVDATQMITSFFAGGDEWAVEQPTFVGQARTYTLYVPSTYDPAVPTPMVITLHGRFGSGAGTADYTQMNQIAEREGFIGLYPDGLTNPGSTTPQDTGWNYVLGTEYAAFEEPNDGAFITDLLDDLALNLNIDQRRVYVDGMSNGGFMVYNLACHYADRFAAFGSVAGSAYYGMEEACQQDTPISLVIIHGTADDNIPWAGRTQTVNGEEYMISSPVLDVLAFWTAHNGCNIDSVTSEDLPQGGASPDTSVRVLTLTDCPNGAELKLYGIVGGGHVWPGIQYEDASYVDLAKVNMDVNAGEALWAFFSRHALPE
jgi:polyhydroxybutyrate depolymerase